MQTCHHQKLKSKVGEDLTFSDKKLKHDTAWIYQAYFISGDKFIENPALIDKAR